MKIFRDFKHFRNSDKVFFGSIFFALGGIIIGVPLRLFLDINILQYVQFWWVILLPFSFVIIYKPHSKIAKWLGETILYQKVVLSIQERRKRKIKNILNPWYKFW